MTELEEKESNKNTLLLYGAIFFIITLVVFAIYIILTSDNVDESTLCVVGKRNNTTAVLIDHTGKFSKSQARYIHSLFDKISDEIPTGDRVTIYYIDSEKYHGLSESVFDRCKPKSPEEASQFHENVSRIKYSFENQFIKPIGDVIEGVVNKNEAKTSPIVESLYDLSSVNSMRKDTQISRVVLISDLLQHTNRLSFYRDPTFSSSQGVGSVIPLLSGVDMNVYFLLRENKKEQYMQNAELLKWWEKLFYKAEVKNLTISKVR